MAKSLAVSSNHDWQTEDDLRTLCRAKEIQKDPKRLAECTAMAKQKMLDMAAVAGHEKG